MYQIEIDGRRSIEVELPKVAWEQFIEIVRRWPEKEVALFKDGDLMMVRGEKKYWSGTDLLKDTKW